MLVVERVKLIGAPVSTKKVEPVLDLIRGDQVELALQKLRLVNKKSAHHIYKLLKSAVANVEHNKKMEVKEMMVLKAWATKSKERRFKRFRPIARGRAHPYVKHRSNIFIEIGYGS